MRSWNRAADWLRPALFRVVSGHPYDDCFSVLFTSAMR